VFDRVTGALDALAADVGGTIDPQISALEAQVDSLASIDETAAEQLAALLSIDAALAGRGTGTNGLTDARPGDDITDAVQGGGNTNEQIATATQQTADQTRQVVQRLDTVAANTARLEGVLLAIQGHAEIDREGFSQAIAQLRASVDAQQQILSQLRFGTLAVAQP
jgi:cell division GTPase FtsZ